MSNLVSIITPSYNSSKFISSTINSVLEQTYLNWEMIIIDDCSNDNSNEIIGTYCKKDDRIKLIRLNKNVGPAIARNIGIELATGKYIAFLDADDLWLPNKLEKQIQFMEKTDVLLCYSSYYIINENDKIIDQFIIPLKKIKYKDLLKRCIIGNLTAVYDAERIGKVMLANVGHGEHGDYTLWLSILKKIDYGYGINEILAKYRLYKGSISSNKVKAAIWQWKIYRNVEKLNFFASIYYFLHYAYYGINKYIRFILNKSIIGQSRH